MENNNNQFIVEDFLLTIVYENSILQLEAEEKSSGKILAISLDSDAIDQITKSMFSNAEDMAQGLKDAVSGDCPELKLTINSLGKLTYTAIFTAGRIKKEDGFSINLAEKPVEPDEVLNRRFKALEIWKNDHESKMTRLEKAFQAFQEKCEERMNKFENMVLQMQQNLTQRLETLEKMPQVKVPSHFFNKDSVNASSYAFNDGNQTVTLLSGSHPCLEILPQIPNKGQHSHVFKINSEKSSICFGITTERNKQNWNGDNCNYRYWTPNGTLYGRVVKNSAVIGPHGGTGRSLKMVVDMDKGILTFWVENKEINSCNISTSDTYFIYVSLADVGDSISLMP